VKYPTFIMIGLCATIVAVSCQALAATAPRPLPHYRCMMLDQTEKQSMDPSVHVEVRSEPQPTASAVGWAGSVVVVKEPITPVNGFLSMLFPTGRPVWIAANQVRPFRSVSDPNARCVPIVLPDGSVGISSK